MFPTTKRISSVSTNSVSSQECGFILDPPFDFRDGEGVAPLCLSRRGRRLEHHLTGLRWPLAPGPRAGAAGEPPTQRETGQGSSSSLDSGKL